MPRMTIIAQVDESWGIMRDGAIPWGFENRSRFDQLTSFHSVIMGRRTAQMFGEPLKNCLNVVLTRQGAHPLGFRTNVVYVGSWELARHVAASHAGKLWQDDYFVIGGGSVFEKARSEAAGAFLTRVPGLWGCDTTLRPFGHRWRKSAASGDFEVWRRVATRELTEEEKRKKHAWRAPGRPSKDDEDGLL